jgi:nitrite reductase (NO-forming)
MGSRLILVIWSVAAAAALTACSAAARSSATSTELAIDGMPRLAGQEQTCSGPRSKTFALEAREVTLDVGLGMRFHAWTYDGRLPAPTLEACEGDAVTITVANHGTTSHGLDSHALRTSMTHFGPVPPGHTLTIHATVDTPGVYMYHCASGPVTDMHIKSGLAGAMIVYPRSQTLRPARELVVLESAIYGDHDPSGLISGTDPVRAMKNDPSIVMFNGRLQHQPIQVNPGDLVRAYYVNVGPGTAAVHVMGTILDRVTDGGRTTDSVQTYGIPAGSGAVVEFRIPEAGTYGLVDHDKLGYVPVGLIQQFDAESAQSHGTR